MRGRGLKHFVVSIVTISLTKSPPMRGRGLKLGNGECLLDSIGRPPCGGVD